MNETGASPGATPASEGPGDTPEVTSGSPEAQDRAVASTAGGGDAATDPPSLKRLGGMARAVQAGVSGEELNAQSVLAAIGVALAAAGFALGILLHDRYRNEAAFGIGFWAVLIALALGLMGSGPVLALSARGREASREVEALRAWVDLPPLERSAALRAEVARSGPRTPERVLPYALAVSPKNLWRGLFELLGSAIMAERGQRDPEWITGPRAGGLVEQLVETAERVAEAERVDSRD